MSRHPNRSIDKPINIEGTKEVKLEDKEVSPQEKVGTFIVIRDRHGNSSRVNLEKIRTYTKNGEMQVSLAWDNGLQTICQYGTIAEADALIDLLDKYCL